MTILTNQNIIPYNWRDNKTLLDMKELKEKAFEKLLGNP
jgi:hypothetical protein